MRFRPSVPVILAALALGLWGIGGAAAAETSDRLDTGAIDEYVNDYLNRNGLPGATVAVVHDGRVVHEAGYGEDSEGHALNEDSRLRIGSVSKSFTAFAVLQLVDAGRVGLDESVTTYLPDLRLGDDRLDDITVRQLLSHTSGIPQPTVVGPADSLAEGMARLKDLELAADPGTHYTYSNINYQIAASLVESVSGRDFGDYLDQRVFGPLEMDSTENVTTTRTPVDVPDGHVTGWGLAFATTEPEQLVSGAGGVVSTSHDMAQWLAMQQRGGKGADGRRLLSADLVEESHTPQENAHRTGFGWQRSVSSSPKRVSHSGSLATFNAQQDLVSESGYGVVVMLDSFTPSREHAYEISSGIIEISEGGEPEVGMPVATLTDLALGGLTLLTVALGVRGVRRSRRWADRRRAWAHWRFGLRLLPPLLGVLLSAYVFIVLPSLQGNSITTTDIFRIFPAVAVLILALGLTGFALLGARVWARRYIQRYIPRYPR